MAAGLQRTYGSVKEPVDSEEYTGDDLIPSAPMPDRLLR